MSLSQALNQFAQNLGRYLPLDDNINIVEFSKDKHNGRYGYLDGIYDVSDES